MQSGPSSDLSDISKVSGVDDSLLFLKAISMRLGEKFIPLKYLFPLSLHLVIQFCQPRNAIMNVIDPFASTV